MISTLVSFLVIVFFVSLRQVNQYENGVMFTMGRYTGMKKAGWRIVLPIFQQMRKVDLRVKAVDVPDQNAITRDNVSVNVNAVIYYKVSSAEKAVLEVEDAHRLQAAVEQARAIRMGEAEDGKRTQRGVPIRSQGHGFSLWVGRTRVRRGSYRLTAG